MVAAGVPYMWLPSAVGGELRLFVSLQGRLRLTVKRISVGGVPLIELTHDMPSRTLIPAYFYQGS